MRKIIAAKIGSTTKYKRNQRVNHDVQYDAADNQNQQKNTLKY